MQKKTKQEKKKKTNYEDCILRSFADLCVGNQLEHPPHFLSRSIISRRERDTKRVICWRASLDVLS